MDAQRQRAVGWSDWLDLCLRLNPEFVNKVYDTIEPGTTVIITDQSVVRSRGNAAILEG